LVVVAARNSPACPQPQEELSKASRVGQGSEQTAAHHVRISEHRCSDRITLPLAAH
jgi:hypothetical protein